MSRRRSAAALRMNRLLRLAVIVIFCAVVSVQYVRIVQRNVSVQAQVASEEDAIHVLEAERFREQQHIARLEHNDGAVPEIHDRLHLIAANEALVYLRRPGDGQAAQLSSSP